MDFLINLFIELLGSIVAELFAAVIYTVFYKLTYAMFIDNSKREKAFGIIGVMLLAGAFSILFSLIKPTPMFHYHKFPGISIPIISLVTGLTALIFNIFTKDNFGKQVVKLKPELTKLQLFLGGAIFGFVFSLIRFCIVYDQFI